MLEAARREALLTHARRWIGTPYQHQASVMGVGCDCLGLIRGVWRGVYGAEPEAIPPYGPDWSETSGTEALWRALERHLRPDDTAIAPGQILLFRMRAGSVAKHIGIVSALAPTPRFIHAYSGHGVVESPLSPPWMRRVVARFDMY